MLLALLFGGVTITLAPEAKVRGTEITLGAIAQVAGDDAAEVARVNALRLGYAPAPGYSRVLVAGRVQADVSRMISGLTVTMNGSESCRVLPSTERVIGTTIEAAAKAELSRWLDGRDFEASLVASVADVEVPTGDKNVELRAVLGQGATHSGTVNVPVRVMVDGNVYRTVWTNWQLSMWQDVSVLRVPVKAGETLTLDMLEKRRVNDGGIGPDAPLTPLLVVGSTAAHDLPAGQSLREVDIVHPVLIKRGDAMFLEVRRGAIQARVAAVAEEDGRAGQRIRVKLLDSKRGLSGTVVSRDLAMIDLSETK